MADDIEKMFHSLLIDNSSIYLWNDNHGSVVVITPYGDYAYRDLNEEGRRVQAKLLEEYKRFIALIKALLRKQPKDVLKQLAEADVLLLRTIEQEHTWCKNTQEALSEANGALQIQLNFLKNLHSPADGDIFCVPDTNALLHNPFLEKWKFDDMPSFTIILTPTILAELDSLKINHRNDSVRLKAESLINQIKEFRRRGRLTEGVTIVRDKSAIMAIATEPKIDESLPWLDPANNDDRFLAAIIEVMRLRPRSIIFAVSRDINLQNKAEFARIPFVEPPD